MTQLWNASDGLGFGGTGEGTSMEKIKNEETEREREREKKTFWEKLKFDNVGFLLFSVIEASFGNRAQDRSREVYLLHKMSPLELCKS